MSLFLWKISQDKNNDYDTFDSAVVVSTDPVNASMIHPSRDGHTNEQVYSFNREDDSWVWKDDGSYGGISSWAMPNDIKVVCIGKAGDLLKNGDVVCASYNAG